MKIQIEWLKKEKLGPEEKQACAIRVCFDSGEEKGTLFITQYKDGRIRTDNFLKKSVGYQRFSEWKAPVPSVE